MSRRSPSPVRGKERRGIFGTMFRRKEKAPEPPAEYHHNQLYQHHSPSYGHAGLGPGPHRKEGVDPRGRWAIKAGQNQAPGGTPTATSTPLQARQSGTGATASGGYSPYSVPTLLRQVSRLQDQVAQQAEQLEELHRELEERDAEGEDLRQQLSLERFRYDLIVDLWAMRVLDNEELGVQAQQGAHEGSGPPGR